METVFKINNFSYLDEDVLQEIEDFVADLTTDWRLEIYVHCDICGKETKLLRIEVLGGEIRVCKNCNSKVITFFKGSEVEYGK